MTYAFVTAGNTGFIIGAFIVGAFAWGLLSAIFNPGKDRRQNARIEAGRRAQEAHLEAKNKGR
jgi:uncharacterized membrane protein SpoIIM required for sporulation